MMTFVEWLEIGQKEKWISEIVCCTHDGLPGTEEEEAEWDQGFDPCVPALRVWAVG